MTQLLFIVGVPRSGTTLLRELLSNHRDIAVAIDEMQLFSRLLRRFGTDDDAVIHKKDEIFQVVRKSPFFFHIKKKGIECDFHNLQHKLREAIDWSEYASILIREFLPEKKDAKIVGEKTPSNLLELKRFASSFPKAKFIHIIRDPRDVCLSMKNAWGKGTYRAAVRWLNYIEFFRATIEDVEIARKCHVVRYEDLLRDPELELRAMSNFLGVRFHPSMLTLRSAAEVLGAASGSNQIQVSNTYKFEQFLTKQEISLIESITFEHLNKFGYRPIVAQKSRSISLTRYKISGIFDLAKSSCHHIKDKGLIEGLRYRLMQIYFNT